MRALALRALLVAVLSSAALGVGCDEDEFFRACPMSQSILDICEAESPTTSLTCVVTEHPLCDERICAMWQDSDAFCTRTCSDDAACPDGSTCESYLDFAFCVPLTISSPIAPR